MIQHGAGADEASGAVKLSAVVETASGKVRGEVFRGVSIFRGIPYGAPTSGASRFLPPKSRQSWAGVRESVKYGETAPQARGRLAEGGTPTNRPEIGEDCLVVNVWTPETGAGDRPVLVWLHGGGFEAGSGSSMLYDGTNLARRGDVVCVSINHRLGIAGHCHLADILGKEFEGAANAGYLDIVAALKWVAGEYRPVRRRCWERDDLRPVGRRTESQPADGLAAWRRGCSIAASCKAARICA